MNQKSKFTLLPCIVLGMGCAAAAVRALVYAVCTDSEGLVDLPTFPALIVLALSVAALAVCIAHTRDFLQPSEYSRAMPASHIGAISAFLASLGIAVLLLSQSRQTRDYLALLEFLLGVGSIVCFVRLGIHRIRGTQPNYALFCVLCLFFAAHLVNSYRIWSANTQLSTFVWQLFASITLMLCAYSHARLATGGKGGRRTVIYGLCAMYFSLLCLPDECCKLFYITCGLWALTGICAPAPKEDAHETA